MKTYPLRVFVKRILLFRLAAATAVLTGGVAYFAQRAQLEGQVEDLGRRGLAELTARVTNLVEEESISPVDALHRAHRSPQPAYGGAAPI